VNPPNKLLHRKNFRCHLLWFSLGYGHDQELPMPGIIAVLALASLVCACSTYSGVSAPVTAPALESSATAAAMSSAPVVKVQYAPTRKGDVVDNYFGDKVADPYRWLEDDRSAETAAWVVAQNKVTFDYLRDIPYRHQLQQRLETLWNFERVSAPFNEGNYSYYYKNNGLQDQNVVYRRENDHEEEVFLDPNTFSDDGTTSLSQLSFSRDGSLAAYSISEGGSDWLKIVVKNAETRTQLEPPLVDVKFSNIAWRGNEGFYYSSYDKPEGSKLSAKTDQHKLYFHRIGSSQLEDELVFGGSEEQKRRYVSGSVTEDDRYLVISGSQRSNSDTGWFSGAQFGSPWTRSNGR
jgi:prolyl oligopeptidase